MQYRSKSISNLWIFNCCSGWNTCPVTFYEYWIFKATCKQWKNSQIETFRFSQSKKDQTITLLGLYWHCSHLHTKGSHPITKDKRSGLGQWECTTHHCLEKPSLYLVASTQKKKIWLQYESFDGYVLCNAPLIQNIRYISLTEWKWFFLICIYKVRQYKGIIEKTDNYKQKLLINIFLKNLK